MTSAAGRRADRRPDVGARFPGRAEAALDVLELLDLAWHGRHGDPCPPDDVVHRVVGAADGDVGALASAARQAVTGSVSPPAGHDPRARDVLVLMDLAWHDAYDGRPVPPRVQEEVRTLAGADVARLASAALLAVRDVRDLWSSLDGRRAEPVDPPRRQGRGRIVPPLLGVIALSATTIALLVVVLVHRRDTGSRDRAWDAVGAYAPAAAAVGSDLDPARQASLFEATVPDRSVRERYFRGELQVAWTVVDPATGGVVACVEMRSLSGRDAYGAAWSATAEPAVRRSVAGSGCGPLPASYPAARRAAAGL